MKNIKTRKLLLICSISIVVGLLGILIYKGIVYYTKIQADKIYIEKIYTRMFVNEHQVYEDCMKKYHPKGVTTLTKVVETTYACECLSKELREMIKKSTEESDLKWMIDINTSNDEHLIATIREAMMEFSITICRTEIEQIGLSTAQKKYGKENVH